MDTKVYKFKLANVEKNPHFEEGVKIMDESGLTGYTLRSCLISNNADKISHIFEDNGTPKPNVYLVKTEPKWHISMTGTILDTTTGELLEDQTYFFDDLESGIKRKMSAIRKFTNVYEPLYQARKVSCFFFTLTQANKSDTNIRILVDLLRKRFERNNAKILGFIWVSEISDRGHWHYHIGVATNRLKWKRVPQWAKMDSIWNRRTQITFIQKSIGGYFAKYINKKNIGRIMNFRSYGCSRNYNIPD